MSALATLYAIQTIELTKRFGRTLALDQLNLTVEAGEVFGFLRPNGAGKSTTIRLLLGHLQPTAGQAWIFGDASGDATAAHRHLAYVPADVALWPGLSGAETLELLADIGPGIDRRYRDELMQRFKLEVDRRCGSYSTGNRQKAVLVAAFATEAPLLIFDEPTAGLDPVMEQQFRQCIAAAVVRGQTVFLSSHHLAEVEAVCQRIGILRDGRLVEVAELRDLRRLRLAEVDVSFCGAPPDLERLSGVPRTLCAQLVEERRTASGIAAAVIGLVLLLWMAADGVEWLAWLSWLTPFGLLAEAEPYAATRVGPLAAMAVVVSAVAGLALLAAAHRDVGSGLITGSGIRLGRFRLLRSMLGFAIRRGLPSAFSWAAGLCAYFLIIGLVARSLTEFLIANPRFVDLAAQAGFAGLATVQGYAAALFALLAIPFASRLTHDGTDEPDGRLAVVFARPLPRSRWALVQIALLVAALVALAMAAAVATATGMALGGANLRLTEALAAELNVVPVTVLCLGAAQVAIVWVPQVVFALGAAPAVGGFLLTVLVDVRLAELASSMSPFAHLAWVPATAPDWVGAAGMIGVSVLLAGLGIAGFARRDLRG